MSAKAKTIKMLLYDGTLNGVMNIENSAWESGKMFSAPREAINNLVSHTDCKRYGVYLLLSDQKVYVGQASDLERRTKQHLTDKKWWNQVVLMTTKNDSFNSSDIDYLETSLINIAEDVGKLDSDNKKKGNPKKVDEFRQAELEQYLEEALFLLELIGVRVFKNDKKGNKKKLVLSKSADGIKPPLPDISLGPCVFAKTAFKALMDSGYIFTEEQLNAFGSAEQSKEFTTRNLPLFWLFKDGESRDTLDASIRQRYWKEEYESNGNRFLMYSQWYDNGSKGATKDNFIAWYETL